MNQVTTTNEIADLQREVQRLRQVEQRFRLLVEQVRDCALFSVDSAGNITEWNPGAERIFGYSKSEVLGRPFVDLFAAEEETKDILRSEFEAAAKEGGASAEAWLVRRDGSRFYGRWVTNAVHDEVGRVVGYTTVLRDETEHKRFEEEREQQFRRDCELLQGQVRFTNLALNRTKEELETLAGQLLSAQDIERQAIARDLHDHLAQRLTILEWKVEQLRIQPPSSVAELQMELKNVQEQLSELSAEVRDLSHRLHPSTLEHIGIVAALRSLIEDMSSGRVHPIQFEAANFSEDGVPVEARGALYRIAEEALRNIRKHAGDVPVTIKIERNRAEVHLEIQDQGPGFSQEAVNGKRTLGVISMAERARLLGGTLKLTSLPGKGTTVAVCLPIHETTRKRAAAVTGR